MILNKVYYKKNQQKHLFHIITPSPWPIVGAFGALSLALGFALYIHFFNGGAMLSLSGLTLIIITMIIWWRDVIREATWSGYHTTLVQKGLKIGVILFIISEVMFFFAFFWAFFHSSLAPTVAVGSSWVPKGIIPLKAYETPLLNTGLLLWSGATLTLSHHATRFNARTNIFKKYLALLATIVLALQFTFYQLDEYINAPFSLSDGIYGSTFYMATGLHGLHVLVGTTFLIICFIRMTKGHFTPTHHLGFEAAIWYWHFVDVVWLFLFISIYCWGSRIGSIPDLPNF